MTQNEMPAEEAPAAKSQAMKSNPAPSKSAPFFTSWFGALLSGLNALGTLLIAALVILINIEAFSRTVLGKPFEGVIELIEISIVGIVFLQLGDATRKGVLTRSDGLFNSVMARNRTAGRAMGAITEMLGVIFLALILYGSLPLLAESWREGHYVGVQHVFTAPTWPIKLIIVIGCTVTLLQFLRTGWGYIASTPSPHQGNTSEDGTHVRR